MLVHAVAEVSESSSEKNAVPPLAGIGGLKLTVPVLEELILKLTTRPGVLNELPS